jgi:hypothetical protein
MFPDQVHPGRTKRLALELLESRDAIRNLENKPKAVVAVHLIYKGAAIDKQLSDEG